MATQSLRRPGGCLANCRKLHYFASGLAIQPPAPSAFPFVKGEYLSRDYASTAVVVHVETQSCAGYFVLRGVARYTILPPTIVYRTLARGIWNGGIAKISRSSTTTSANLPVSRLPFLDSSNEA